MFMYAHLSSMGLCGIDCFAVSVEVDCMQSMPSFDIVGLPDTAVKESRDRVRHAMHNNGFRFPAAKVTINLAPAHLKKSGPVYDLPIFLAMLLSTGQFHADTDPYCFVGELSLSGDIRPVQGVLPMVIQARADGFRAIFVPRENAAEASLIDGIEVYGAENVQQILHHLEGKELLTPTPKTDFSAVQREQELLDFADVKGQDSAKYAMKIAAAGGHNLLMIGAPGSGKSMLAKRLPSILPPPSFEEAIECTKIHSVAGELNAKHPFVVTRPFRAPHHTISAAGLSGGGSNPKPGEISLAHNGVLFLDELPEFSRAAMEILRQPLEDGCVTIARVSSTVTYPCRTMLVAAMNPCPCGYYGSGKRPCTCTPTAVQKYLSRISGPLLDRIDLHIEVLPIEYEEISSRKAGESSAEMRREVARAREFSAERLEKYHIDCNAHIPPSLMQTLCPLSDKANALMKASFDKLGLSARAHDKLLKVSRTIADMNGSEVIEAAHLMQAIQYRSLDRKFWSK